MLHRDDLPADWEEQPLEDRPDHEATWAGLTMCLGFDAVEPVVGRSATSPTYVLGVGTLVTSTVSYLDSGDRARDVATVLVGDRFSECARQVFSEDVERNAPEGATGEQIEVSPFPFRKLGDATSAYRATTTIRVPPGVSIPVVQDFVTVVDGTAMVRLVFISGGGPFPGELQRSLVEKVVGRA